MTPELILGFLAKGMLTGFGSQIAKRGFSYLLLSRGVKNEYPF